MSDFLVGAAVAADAIIKDNNDNKHTQSQAQFESYKLMDEFKNSAPKTLDNLPKVEITGELNDPKKMSPIAPPTAEELAKVTSNPNPDATQFNPKTTLPAPADGKLDKQSNPPQKRPPILL